MRKGFNIQKKAPRKKEEKGLQKNLVGESEKLKMGNFLSF